MHGAPPLLLAAMAIPTAWQCLGFGAPFLVVAVLWWLIGSTDEILQHLFPHWEWERRLGWLNITAQKRAETFLRGIGHLIHAFLALALYGIVWSVQDLPALDNWADPYAMGDLALHVPVLLVCIGVWLLYFGFWLLPTLRDRYEREELEKFRAEMEDLEQERMMNPVSRIKTLQPKPRTNAPAKSPWSRPKRR